MRPIRSRPSYVIVHLQLGDGGAEGLPLGGVLDGRVEGVLRDPHGLRRDADPPRVKGRHGNLEEDHDQ